ncbi:hypothetical protein [Nonomuraea solani]|uniref:hypothetical protein n=1 Tax=Nonomuraea solani TaxID=1144553 RepID=UPI000CDEE70B|nr:hypothetical protein [Nonomuraea solani]
MLVLAGGAVVLYAASIGTPVRSSQVAAGPELVEHRIGGSSELSGRETTAGAEARARQLPRPAPSASAGSIEGAAPEESPAGGPGAEDGEGYKADGPSRHTDQQAAQYFRTHWTTDDKALKRLKDIRTVGGYLRIYTDLPESADNSTTALALCERGLEYLRLRGVRDPVVFVQAEFGGNGNPVLANILGPADRTCRVTHPAPD